VNAFPQWTTSRVDAERGRCVLFAVLAVRRDCVVPSTNVLSSVCAHACVHNACHAAGGRSDALSGVFCSRTPRLSARIVHGGGWCLRPHGHKCVACALSEWLGLRDPCSTAADLWMVCCVRASSRAVHALINFTKCCACALVTRMWAYPTPPPPPSLLVAPPPLPPPMTPRPLD
jgi:hypothetical protein